MAQRNNHRELGVKVQEHRDPGKQESHLISMIERADAIRWMQKQMGKAKKGTLDVPQCLNALSMRAVLEVGHLLTAEETPDKLRFEVAKDVMDRAGHGKTQKIAVGHMHIDPQATKTELINMIMSSAKSAGIDTKEEAYVEGSDYDVIDAELSDNQDNKDAGKDTREIYDQVDERVKDDRD